MDHGERLIGASLGGTGGDVFPRKPLNSQVFGGQLFFTEFWGANPWEERSLPNKDI